MRRAALLLIAGLFMAQGYVQGQGYRKAIFAGGCFWCMQKPFDQTPGVVKTVVGYTGGNLVNPTYEQVSTGMTGHFEAVEITYDPAVITYDRLLDVFWRQIDPVDKRGQFADKGSQYRTAIFYADERQRKLAQSSKEALEKSGKFAKPVATLVLPAEKFYPAEEYHQEYYKKSAARYGFYSENSGRKQFIKKNWGAGGPFPKDLPGCPLPFKKPPEDKLKKILTGEQFNVTQNGGTEPPFNNAFWNNHRAGIYVDVVSGEVLFSSNDKFDSGTGWPSFTRPLVAENVVPRKDNSHAMVRTEVRSLRAGSHLGHVFDDGPGPGGKRYCINSAALRFIPKEELEKEGYGDYLKLF